MSEKSISIIVPALDEEGNIRSVCEDIAQLAEKHLSKYEILVYDDASHDRTAEIVEELQKANEHILLFRNSTSQGLGGVYRAGVRKARYQYVMLIPGDNQVVAESLEGIFAQIGTTDVIVCYITNQEVRAFRRQLISRLFTGVLNFLFWLNLGYYNGTSVIRTSLVTRYLPYTSGYAYMAVILVHLLKLGTPYKQMGFAIRKRQYGVTKAFRFKNILSVMKNVIVLFWKVMVCRKLKHSKLETLQGKEIKHQNLPNISILDEQVVSKKGKL